MDTEPAGDPPVAPQRSGSVEPDPTSTPGSRSRTTQLLASHWTAFATLAAAVVGFAGAWTRGTLVTDGHGMVIYVRLVLDQVLANGRPSYWIPEMWAGTPVWAVGPSFPVLLLVPFAGVVGPAAAVKVGILALQVAGAWGAYVLARSLWDDVPGAMVAGLVYGLNPVIVSHGALAGSESSIGVMAATPWLVWALRRGLRGDGTRYLVAAGLVGGFAVLHQAEYAYGLALLCAFLVVVEIGRIRQGLAGASARALVGRVGLVLAVSAGATAHWLLPFLALHESFVLSPPELVRSALLQGSSSEVGRELGLFLHRSPPLHGVVSGDRVGLITHVVYLGAVPVAVTVLSAILLARRDDDRTLSAVLVVSTIAVWMSTGAASLATGGPVARGQVVPLAVTGLVVGVVAGGFLRRMKLGRATGPVLVAVAASLFAAPYLSPFVLSQRVIPLLSSIRFPRFYVLAVLGLALGTAWPITRVREWLPANRQRLAGIAAGALAVVTASAVLIDAWPIRSLYWLQSPPDAAAYRQASATLATRPPGSRVAPLSLDSRPMASVLRTGADLSMGWPHPVAGAQIWNLTAESVQAPVPYALRALGLSSTSFIVQERIANRGSAVESVSEAQLTANPRALPLVRAYDRTLVVGDRSVSPALAVALAFRNVGVVAGGAGARSAVAATAVGPPIPASACESPAVGDLPSALAGETAIACGMQRWVPSTFNRPQPVGVDRTPGAEFLSPADGLRGVSVWFAGTAGQSELVLHELAPDGRSPGPEVARGRASGVDEYGMTAFSFDPVAGSAGKRYVFQIQFQCPDCYSELAPQILVGSHSAGGGNLLLNGRLDRNHLAAFAPVYERMQPAPPSSTEVEGHRRAPGRWLVRTSGPRPALVVVAEANFPGWRARVDGRPAPVLEADGAFLGVPVGPGTHEVTLDFHPPAAANVGRLITAITLAAILAGGLNSRRRRRRHALEVGTPPGEPSGEETLGPGEGHPRPTVADGEGPGAEGDEAVLAAVDDPHPDRLDHPQQVGGGEP